MPFNASGVFQRLYSWRTDRDAGVKVLADRMDQETDGIVEGINSIVEGDVAFKGPVLGVNGTAASPAWSFASDPDTGIYRHEADGVSISVGGSQAVQFDADLSVDFKGVPSVDGDIIYHEGNAPFVPISGGTLTGDLTIDKDAANITLKAPTWDADVSGASSSAILLTDQNDALTGLFGHTNTTAGVLRVENYVGQNVYTAADDHFHDFFVGTDKIVSMDENLEAFGNVYVTKSSPSMFLAGSGTKNLYFRNESDDNVGRVYYSTDQESMRVVSYDGSGANGDTYIFNNSSQTRSASSVLRQSEGDTRYLRKDAVTGSFDVGGGQISNVNEIRVDDGSQTDPSFTFQSAQDTGVFLGSVGVAFTIGGEYAAVVLEDGSSTVSSNGVITREKGDARYSQTSSLRYKEEIDQNPVDREGVLDKLQVHTWRWGGETPQSNETFGTVGFGLIAEEVETIIPEAVTYRMVGDEEAAVRTINGLDPLALIAVLVEEVQVLVEEVQVLRAEVDILKQPR